MIGDEPIGTVDKDPFVGLMNKYTVILEINFKKSSYKISIIECLQSSTSEYRPVLVNRDVLRGIDPTHVLICKWPAPLRWKFYKVILTNEPITKCEFCNRVISLASI